MGQKVHPIGFRLGSYRKWDSVWFARKVFAYLVLEVRRILDFIKVDKELKGSGVAGLDIKRAANKLTIKSIPPGRAWLSAKKARKSRTCADGWKNWSAGNSSSTCKRCGKPEINAQLVAENIAQQLERRVSVRRAMKKSVGQALKFRAKGIKVRCKGRWPGRKSPGRKPTAKARCRSTPCGP